MLIPSIDLQSGKIVQLVQGERLALEREDVFAIVERFKTYPKVQLIDLDAAMGKGGNQALVAEICGRLSCRVGGGIRNVSRAGEVLAAGATHAIVGSALFKDGRPDTDFARTLADECGPGRVIAAVDSRGGHVVIHGWKTVLPITAAEAVAALEPYVSEFLYTHVDNEGLMRGTDMDAIKRVQAATSRRVTAAGGITTWAEIEELDRLGIDAVVGMALYTGLLQVPE